MLVFNKASSLLLVTSHIRKYEQGSLWNSVEIEGKILSHLLVRAQLPFVFDSVLRESEASFPPSKLMVTSNCLYCGKLLCKSSHIA